MSDMHTIAARNLRFFIRNATFKNGETDRDAANVCVDVLTENTTPANPAQGVSDEMVEAALNSWFDGEIPVSFSGDFRADMRAALTAAIGAGRSSEPEFETAPDNGTPAEVLAYVLDCARRWVPEARIIGNARAGDIERAIAAIGAGGQAVAELHGPFGWLNGHRALSEDSWTLESDPLENSDEYFAIPLYALTDPFNEIGKDWDGRSTIAHPVQPGWRECATDGCVSPATIHFARGGVGSYYCYSCYCKIQALPTSRAALADGGRDADH